MEDRVTKLVGPGLVRPGSRLARAFRRRLFCDFWPKTAPAILDPSDGAGRLSSAQRSPVFRPPICEKEATEVFGFWL